MDLAQQQGKKYFFWAFGAAFFIEMLFAGIGSFAAVQSGIRMAKEICFVNGFLFLLWTCTFFVYASRKHIWSQLSRWELWIGVLLILLLSGFAFGTIWGGGYLSLDPIKAVVSGKQHLDSLFHAALAGGVATYGVPSLLVNTTDVLRYHTFSHEILGLISRATGVPSFLVYCYFFPTVMAPLYAFALISTCGRAREVLTGETVKPFSVVELFMIVAFSMGLLPEKALNDIAMWPGGFFDSESFVCANTLTLFYGYILLGYKGYDTMRKRLCLWVLTPVAIVVCSHAKISVGALLTAGWMFYIVRMHTREASYWGLFLLYGIAFLVGFDISHASEGASTHFRLFDFVRTYGGRQIIFYYFVGYFMLWLLIWYRLRTKAITLRMLCFDKKYIVEQTLTVVCFFGALPGILLAIGGGSAGYFSAPTMLATLVILIGFDIPRRLYEAMTVNRVDRIAVYILLAVALSVMAINMAPMAYHAVSGLRHGGWGIGRQSTFYKNIESINKLTAGHKTEYAIFVDDSAEVWDIYGEDKGNSLRRPAFIYPALTNLLSLNAVCLLDGGLYTHKGDYICNVQDAPYGYGYASLHKEPKRSIEEVLEYVPDHIEHVIVMHGDSYFVVDVERK